MKDLGNFKKILPVYTTGGNIAAQQYRIMFEHGWVYQSYESVIAVHNSDTGHTILGGDWDYSKTTRNYLYSIVGVTRKDILEDIKNGSITYKEDLR